MGLIVADEDAPGAIKRPLSIPATDIAFLYFVLDALRNPSRRSQTLAAIVASRSRGCAPAESLSCAGDFETRPCSRSLASAPIRSSENQGVACEA
jgi:hypothetical protein